MKKGKFNNKHLNKFSGISGVDLKDLLILDELGALDSTGIIFLLVKNDYKKLTEGTEYTGRQIRDALAKEYNISPHYVESIIYNKKNNKMFFCKCGEEMSQYKFTKNKGVCDKCIAESIKKSIQ